MIEILPHLSKNKEYYQSYLKEKLSKITAWQPKTTENSNIVDIKSSIIKYPEISYKLCRTIKQAEKVSQICSADSLLFSETKRGMFLEWKKVKTIKWSHVYRGYESTCNVDIFNSFNPDLLLKHFDFSIKNKLKNIKLRGSKFITTLVLESEIWKMMMKQTLPLFILIQKQKQVLMKVILMIYLNHSILRLYTI